MTKKSAKKKTAKNTARKAAKLNDKQLRFIEEYLVDLNATQAAIRAGYSERSAYSQGERLLKHDEVLAEINKRKARLSERCDVKAADVIRQLSRSALSDPRKLVNEDGSPKGLHELPDDIAMAIQGVDVVTIGNSAVDRGQVLKYRMADKNSAADKLMKHLGLYEKDNSQKTLADATDDEIKEAIRRKIAGLQARGIDVAELIGGNARHTG